MDSSHVCCPVLLYDALKSLENSSEKLKASNRLSQLLVNTWGPTDNVNLEREHTKLTHILLDFYKNNNISCSWKVLNDIPFAEGEQTWAGLQRSVYVHSLLRCKNALSKSSPKYYQDFKYLCEAYGRAFSENGTKNKTNTLAEGLDIRLEKLTDTQLIAFSISMCVSNICMIGLACSERGLVAWSIFRMRSWGPVLDDLFIDNKWWNPTRLTEWVEDLQFGSVA